MNLPAGLGPLSAIACPGANDCIAVGENTGGAGVVIETSNGGTTWQEDSLPSNAQPLLSISCSAPGSCVATGGTFKPATGAIYRQSSVEDAFVAETEPTGEGLVEGVSCPSGTSFCAALADDPTQALVDDVLGSSDGGVTWSVAQHAINDGSASSPDAMQCFDASTCVAVGTSYDGPSVFSTTTGWTSYTGNVIGNFSAYLDSLTCPEESFCLASGLTGNFAGSLTGSWNESTNPSGIGQILGSLCTTSTTCAVVGNTTTNSNAYLLNGPGAILTTATGGGTWTSESMPSGTGSLFGLACSPSGSCFAVGETYVSGGGNGSAGLLSDNGDVLNSGTGVVPLGSPYSIDSNAGGSPSEICQRQANQTAQVDVAQPVNTATGDYWHSTTDLEVPGPGCER